jgi:hypothetical protein
MSKAKKKNPPAEKTRVEKPQVDKPIATEVVKKAPDAEGDRLHAWNKWLAIVYGVQALALLLFSLGRLFPVTIHFLGMDTLASQAVGHTVYTAASRHLFDVSLPQLLAMSLAISAATHGILSRWMREQYASWIRQGSNPIRWLDGAFSTSLLLVVIGLVAGLSDVTSLLMLFALGFVVHLSGLYMESYNQPYTSKGKPVQDYRPFILLCITAAAAWLALGGAILSAAIFGAGLPPGVWIAYLVGSIFAAAYAFVTVQGYRRVGRWAEYRNNEMACVIVSFIAKSSVAWLLFSAVLKP